MDEFDYEKFYANTSEEMGIFLMKAFHSAFLINELGICERIEEIVKGLTLPQIRCEVCKETIMSFFDYHLRQGCCDSCRAKQEMEEEEVF